MSSEIKQSGSLFYRIVKRLSDIFFSAVLMVPVGIVIGIVGLFIIAEDKGPIFYVSDRTGRFGKTFKMYKLRSMKVDAPDIRLHDGSTYNGEDDPRVTRVGKFCRKTSIDELPQVINILKGDMSFIGPRPDTLVGSTAYTEEEKIILNTRPGITGYNQAINRNSVLTKEKLKNDIYYVKHLSLWFDIRILFMTIATVMKHKSINRVNASMENTYIIKDNGSKSSTDSRKRAAK